ncbi:MAG: hypothetical protein EAZ91_23280 [Cytophagales bacterium]|nr:MAG: hypothetical protein EAZ91_23280 [Cytophagales bacterium]
MRTTKPSYVGYREADQRTPYARFFNDQILPLPPLIQALVNEARSAIEPPFALADAPLLQQAGYLPLENGYRFLPDDSCTVAVRTDMPGVTPPMWDWWFGWHGSQDNRYKLWHPKAHISAVWADGRDDLPGYIGRTSLIQEYIGKSLEKASIRFVNPTELGFAPDQLADKNRVVYICARTGFSHLPVDFGWLVHQVRATETGAEMRSRFWMGGSYIQFRTEGQLGRMASQVAQALVKPTEQQALALLNHCFEEMNHLAGFLPTLYNQYQ